MYNDPWKTEMLRRKFSVVRARAWPLPEGPCCRDDHRLANVPKHACKVGARIQCSNRERCDTNACTLEDMLKLTEQGGATRLYVCDPSMGAHRNTRQRRVRGLDRLGCATVFAQEDEEAASEVCKIE